MVKTLSRAKSSFREVSNFFHPAIPIDRRVMKTSMAGLAEALGKDLFQSTTLGLTFQDRRRQQPGQLPGQILQL